MAGVGKGKRVGRITTVILLEGNRKKKGDGWDCWRYAAAGCKDPKAPLWEFGEKEPKWATKNEFGEKGHFGEDIAHRTYRSFQKKVC